MKTVYILALPLILGGCVAGAPKLTSEQSAKADQMMIVMAGTAAPREFNVINTVEAADCSGPGGSRLYGDEGKAIDVLKRKAAALGADAVVDVSCKSAPYVNNCWLAKLCAGKAVSWR